MVELIYSWKNAEKVFWQFAICYQDDADQMIECEVCSKPLRMKIFQWNFVSIFQPTNSRPPQKIQILRVIHKQSIRGFRWRYRTVRLLHPTKLQLGYLMPKFYDRTYDSCFWLVDRKIGTLYSVIYITFTEMHQILTI